VRVRVGAHLLGRPPPFLTLTPTQTLTLTPTPTPTLVLIRTRIPTPTPTQLPPQPLTLTLTRTLTLTPSRSTASSPASPLHLPRISPISPQVDRILAYFFGEPEDWGAQFDAEEQARG